MKKVLAFLLAGIVAVTVWADRYVDNGNGTITDTAAKLMWLKDPSTCGTMNWPDAVNYCEGLVTNGYSDWRLPSVDEASGPAELDTLFRAGGNPAGEWEGFGGTPFTNVQYAFYWSSVNRYGATNEGTSWGIWTGDGQTTYGNKTQSFPVWPVRNTNAPPPVVLVVSGTDMGHIMRNLTIVTPAPFSWNLEITSTNANALFTVTPTAAANLLIAWGDGSVSNYTGSSRVDHYYADAGTYALGLSGGASRLRFGHDVETRNRLTKCLSAIQNITGLTSFENTFYNCTLLTTMPADLLVNAVNVTNLSAAWYNCYTVTALPAVNSLTSVTTLSSAWGSCYAAPAFPDVSALTNVITLDYTWQSCFAATNFPDVSALVKVNTLAYTWWGCTAGITFPNVSALTNVTTLSSTWYGCSKGVSFPDVSALTKVSSLAYAWYYCTAATSFPSVSTLTNVTTLASTWRGCVEATSFPDVSTLTNVTTLNSAWYGCSKGISFPDVSALTRVTSLAYAWRNCYAMTSCPPIFPGNATLANVANVFNGCSNIVSAVPAFWDTNIWSNTNLLTAANHTNAFKGCTNASNYGDIPAGWK